MSGIIQAPNSANAVPMGANTNSRTILATPNVPFSAGIHRACRTPISTLSWITKIAVAAAEPTNSAASMGSSRSGECGEPKCRMPSRQAAASSAEAPAANP